MSQTEYYGIDPIILIKGNFLSSIFQSRYFQMIQLKKQKIKALFSSVLSHMDKLLNTIIWLVLPRNKVIVINVWMKHRGSMIIKYNFGDDLNLFIIQKLSNKVVINYKYSYLSIFHPINFLCIGSIVDYMSNRQSVVWGSGAMCDTRIMKDLPKQVCAVRGPLTRKYLLSQDIKCPAVYGDPALLLPLIYSCKPKKQYKIGIIPHIIDIHLDSVISFKNNEKDVLVIDFHHYDNIQGVIEQINKCEVIGSSSLHGLIIADAYNIPNVWLKLSDSILGNDFKFADYFGGVERTKTEFLDFRNKSIEYNTILDAVKYWEPIKFNKEKLLYSCPFLHNDVKQILIEKCTKI